MARFARLAIAATACGLLFLGALLPLGCWESPRQTTVIPADKVDSGKDRISALERGKIRREAIREMGKAMGLWRSRDLKGMSKSFNAALVAKEKKISAEQMRSGRLRVRKHQNVSIDVLEMTPKGDEVSLEYRFTDQSYYTDAKTGRVASSAAKSGKGSTFRIVAEKTRDGWMVVAFMGGKEALQ